LEVTYPRIAFWGVMNLFLIYPNHTRNGLRPVPLRRKKQPTRTVSSLLVRSHLLSLLPLAYISHRISYIFYFQNTVPAVAGAIALMLSKKQVPRAAVIVYAILVLAGFAWYFLFRQIPPQAKQYPFERTAIHLSAKATELSSADLW
jgi:hypothetical protein